jgi:acyl carrier protein
MAANATQDTVLEVVTDTLVRFGAEREDIVPDATFEALDIDSLDLAELGQIVEERFAVQLKSADVKDIKNVGELVELIVARA